EPETEILALDNEVPASCNFSPDRDRVLVSVIVVLDYDAGDVEGCVGRVDKLNPVIRVGDDLVDAYRIAAGVFHALGRHVEVAKLARAIDAARVHAIGMCGPGIFGNREACRVA